MSALTPQPRPYSLTPPSSPAPPRVRAPLIPKAMQSPGRGCGPETITFTGGYVGTFPAGTFERMNGHRPRAELKIGEEAEWIREQREKADAMRNRLEVFKLLISFLIALAILAMLAVVFRPR